MAQNDATYKAGDKVCVFESGQLAALVEAGQTASDGNPRMGVIAREHASEPNTLEVVYKDGSSEFITDTLRLRPAGK